LWIAYVLNGNGNFSRRISLDVQSCNVIEMLISTWN
jgi:hypothetical protein